MRLRPALLAAVALATAGCAGPRAGTLARRERLARTAPRGARADFSPANFHGIFASAVDVVRARGLRVETCDPVRGALVTAPVELDAPCGGTTCLAREAAVVKLGHRHARVTLTREVWDPTVRAWTVPHDEPSREDVSRSEQELLSRMLAPDDGEAPRSRAERRDPCASAHCGGGTCVAASGVSAR